MSTAGGANITIKGGNITVQCPGKLTLRAGRKSFTGDETLASPLPMEELGYRLTRWLQAEISGQMQVMLRYFDPRVFEAWLSVSSDEQKPAFLGAADCWWYPDRRGQLVIRTALFERGDTLACPLRLDARQEFALLDASEVDQMAALVQSMMPEPELWRGVMRAGG